MPRVLIADDSDSLRKALRLVLPPRGGWEVCGEACNGGQAVEMASALKPDVVLLDFQMPIMNGLRAAEKILEQHPSTKIVMYTLHKEPILEAQAKAAGIHRIVSKGDIVFELLPTLEELAGNAARKDATESRWTASEEPPFDIFMGPASRSAVWVQQVRGLAQARAQMRKLAARAPGKYFIFAPQSHTILAQVDTTNVLQLLEPTGGFVYGVECLHRLRLAQRCPLDSP